MGSLELPQLSLVVLVGLLELSLVGVGSVGVLDHGQGLSVLDVDDLVFLLLAGGDNPPLGRLLVLLLALLVLLVHLGDWSILLLAGSQVLGLSVLNTVESEAVVLGSLVTLLGDEDLVPWATGLLVVSDDLGSSLPVVVVGATTAVFDDLSELLVSGDNLSLAAEHGWGTVSLLALDALFLLLVPVLTLWALFLGPAALVGVALEVAVAGAWGSALLVLILSVARLVLAGEGVAWARLAGVGSSDLELTGLARFRRGGR